jgi:hypothetical protein
MLRCVNGGVLTIKTWTSDNWKWAQNGQMNRPSRWSLHQKVFTFGEHPRKPTVQNAYFEQWNTREVLGGLGQQYDVILLVPLLPFMAKLLQRSMWAGWVITCIP